MSLNYDYDGLCKESNQKGEKNDCAVCAVTAATDYSYDDVHWTFNLFGRKNRRCTPVLLTRKVLDKLGYTVKDVTSVYLFSALKVKTVKGLQEVINPNGTYLVRTRQHIFCIRNGQVLDHAKDSRRRILDIWKVEEKSV